jgi:DNA modification methylase
MDALVTLVEQEKSSSDSIQDDYRRKLALLLNNNLDFHDEVSNYASHDLHSFPAKFPPQLPNKFITSLTVSGDIVLDPMMGSGTTVLEAFLTGRKGVGFDIDPLARLVAKVKTTTLDPHLLIKLNQRLYFRARETAQTKAKFLERKLEERWNDKTKDFVDYWFAEETQRELLALVNEIEQIENPNVRAFFEVVLSAIIITKSGGVSMAFDLGHTRPHRAKVVYDRAGNIILGQELTNDHSPRIQFLTKTLRSPLEEWIRRFEQNLKSIQGQKAGNIPAIIDEADAQVLPLNDNSVHLIVTSPPYASNAIDYMRAHKFSLVWLGYDVDTLTDLRREYIGGQSVANIAYEELPPKTCAVIQKISEKDDQKGRILHRYYSEMTRVLKEMYRVLKFNASAIVVVGSSTMRGVDTQTDLCLAEIGESIGFEVPGIGVRNIDRDRRMLPAGNEKNQESQIQQRMHQEYVIGFYKPKELRQ